MEYYNQLDSYERDVLENYSNRLNSTSKLSLFSPQTSQRTFNSQRLPALHSFSSVLAKPRNTEIVPKPEVQENTDKKTPKVKKLRKRSAAPRLNGRFYTEKGLNSKHPDLSDQIKKILNLVEAHKLNCHKDLKLVDFTGLKKHFLGN